MKARCVAVVVSMIYSAMLAANPSLDEPIKPLPLQLDLDPKKVELGRMLFHETRLSADDSISCSTCHRLDQAGTDRQRVSTGINGHRGAVNSPTVFNSGFNFRQFWDGRARTLEEQVAGPLHNPKEMGSNWTQAIEKLKLSDRYREFFRIYPDGITAKNISNAIATFERSLYTPNSRFDQYLRGRTNAITAEEERGYKLFKSFGCISCHQGVNVGGNMFQKFGVMKDYFKYRRSGNINEADYGRYNVTRNESDKHYFKVPSLRLVALTPPYFHDGSAKTLREAVDVMFEFQLGRIGSDDEKEAIIKFLKSLPGEFPEQGMPRLSNVQE